jgi:hypothetical protein
MPSYGNDLAQSYRLYTLALAGSPDLSSMNRLRETKGIRTKVNCVWLRLMYWRTKSAGFTLLLNTSIDDTHYNYYYYGSADRNRAMARNIVIAWAKAKKHL